MTSRTAFLDEVRRQLDDLALEAQDVRAKSHDRVAIADVEAQLAALRRRLERGPTGGSADQLNVTALEVAVERLNMTIEDARKAA
jgi:hypothetical protein